MYCKQLLSTGAYRWLGDDACQVTKPATNRGCGNMDCVPYTAGGEWGKVSTQCRNVIVFSYCATSDLSCSWIVLPVSLIRVRLNGFSSNQSAVDGQEACLEAGLTNQRSVQASRVKTHKPSLELVLERQDH